jgi:hypothetical protein
MSPDYASWLATHNVADSGGRPLPAWGVRGALSVMDLAGTWRATLSVSAPGTTAVSGSEAALPSPLAFAKPGHVMFGSDWPFAPRPAVQYFTSGLDHYKGADQATHDAINHGNAAGLFPG